VDQQKQIYFVSDAHLGTPDYSSSLIREKKLVQFLDEIKSSAEIVFFLGDIFDFWFEYKWVVPRGFNRLIGKICELADAGIHIHFFTGNHDIWAFNYLEKEAGVEIHRSALITELYGKTFFLAHGDGFDESDKIFRFLKSIFTNRFLQWMFARLHPNFAFGLANKWSKHSRYMHEDDEFKYEDEGIVKFARKYLLNQGYDYLVFGHRHCPIDYPLNESSRLIILGDWMTHFTYGVLDRTRFQLKKY